MGVRERESLTTILFVFLCSVNIKREGSSVDSALLVADGNASMTLRKLKVSDEGTYICTVSVGSFQAQQTIKLNIHREFSLSTRYNYRKNIP